MAKPLKSVDAESTEKRLESIVLNPQSQLKIAPLNTLGKGLQSKTRTKADAEFIRKNLAPLMKATESPKPRGKCQKDYRLSMAPQDERFDATMTERRLEAKLWRTFEAGSTRFYAGIRQIVAFQVPLYSARAKGGWGSIDLLGIEDATRYPAVIELKVAKRSIEPPLRAVVEAFAYMFALRVNWADFGPQWHQRTNEVCLPTPQKLTAVVLAPQDYWTAVRQDHYLRDSLPALKELIDELADFGYLIRFASIAAKDIGGWKIDGTASEINIPFSE